MGGAVYVAVVGPGDASPEASTQAEAVGAARNAVVVRSADAVVAVAVGGGYGTLSEIALALKLGRPVVGLGTWDVNGVEIVATPAEAARRALERVRK